MRIFLGLGAASLLAGGCLLAKSLDGLEGPPLTSSGGAGGSGGSGTGSGGSSAGTGPSGGGGGDAADAGADAGPPTPILFQDRSKAGIPRGIAVSDEGVYWAEVSPLGILFAPKGDASAPVVHVDSNTDSLNDVFDVAADDTYLYWTEYTQGIVHRKPLAGSNMDTTYFNGAGHAAYLALSGNGHVYLTDYNTNIAAVVEGPPSLSVANNQKPPAAGIAFCSGSVFWAWGQPSVFATKDSMSTLPAEYPVPLDPGSITGFACDVTNFYWIQDNRSIRWTDRIRRVAEEPLYTAEHDFGAANNVADIAVDTDWIYFTKPLDRAIYKLAKPLSRR